MNTALALLRGTRPRQWPKNAFVFAALVFAPKLKDLDADLRTLACFVIFCLVSGAVYLVNDIRDLEKDRLHPIKKRRPIASGELSASLAGWCAALFMAMGLLGSWALTPKFTWILSIYIVLNLLYSFLLKHEVIIDILLIAIGYLLRVEAGGVVIDVTISNYLWLCTILLALLLAIGKRRHELLMVEDAANHRAILKEYSPELLDQMMGVTTASILVSYALYTQEAVGGEKNLIWTVPFVIYGIFRYLYLIHKKEMGGDPAEILFEDWRMTLNILLWVVVSVVFIYLDLN
ncbi:MAG: Decaprenyl-phosphate phosphoribosyltransferase [bacterium]|nr:Decaprenyl-phosphate phosphoribosyltransferase [bacterium]